MARVTPLPSRPPFDLNPANEFDEFYTAAVRKTLSTFHKNLSKGQYAANGLLWTKDCQWNYDGSLLLGRESAVAALTAVAGAFEGLEAPDYYHIIDGHVGAVLYGLQGPQTGPFAGEPVRPGARINVRGGELMVFNNEALLRDLITIDPIEMMRAQVAGNVIVPPATPGVMPRQNPQTSPSYRALLRQNIAMLHSNINFGNASANAAATVEHVVVDDNGSVATGRDAFVRLVSAQGAGLGAFPQKMFFDDHILADGRLGAVQYVWHGTQKGHYMGMEAKGGVVRMRGMLFFEFDDSGQVLEAVGVYDEGVVATQLQRRGEYLYP